MDNSFASTGIVQHKVLNFHFNFLFNFHFNFLFNFLFNFHFNFLFNFHLTAKDEPSSSPSFYLVRPQGLEPWTH